jgi:hypothetical protein
MSELEPIYSQFLREKQFLSGFSIQTIKLFRWTFNRWDAHIGELPNKTNVKDWVIKLTQSGLFTALFMTRRGTLTIRVVWKMT